MKQDQVPFSITRKEGWIIVLTLFVLVAAFLVFNHLSVPYARSWDIEWGYYATLGTFLVLVSGLVVNAKEIFGRVKSHVPSTKSLIVLAFLLVFFTLFSVNHIEN